jgi:hypothetical protein
MKTGETMWILQAIQPAVPHKLPSNDFYTAPMHKLETLFKSSRFHGGDYGERRLLGYKTPVRTSLETHVPATEPCQLMLCKTRSLHGSDYEECRLLGYKNRVRTSQEICYDSATKPSRLKLCKTRESSRQ